MSAGGGFAHVLRGVVGRLTRPAVAAAVFPLLVGCAQEITEVAEYPSGWTGIAPSSDCAGLAGLYRDLGERATVSPQEGYLDDGYWFLTQLTTGHEARYSGSNGVTLSFPEPGVFAIKGGAERRFSFANGEAACIDGRLELRRSWSDRGIRGGTWWHTTITLSRAGDGWLIAEWQEWETARWLWIVPSRMRLRDWYRYQPIPESVAELSMPAASMRNIWAKDNATHLQSPDDSERCGRAYIGDRLYGRCMKSKGWRRIDVPGRPGYLRRGGAYTVP